eukprot:TRINITY_DN11129_c0_g1_i3.p1 TRINITY_DN11129_c0_g1~~TRINITY_DN11129_c0_g1_i3.p1  ORF type:complete len:782 (+),score=126.19 TRINITY_DN11129_c0_g1_i3:62-2407(+)
MHCRTETRSLSPRFAAGVPGTGVVPAQLHPVLSSPRVVSSGSSSSSGLGSRYLARSSSPVFRQMSAPVGTAADAQLASLRRQLALVRQALVAWPAHSTELALREAADFVRRSCSCQVGQPWSAEEVRCFGKRMFATHGVEPTTWSATTWAALLRTALTGEADFEGEAAGDATAKLTPPNRQEAARFGKLAFELLAKHLESCIAGAAMMKAPATNGITAAFAPATVATTLAVPTTSCPLLQQQTCSYPSQVARASLRPVELVHAQATVAPVISGRTFSSDSLPKPRYLSQASVDSTAAASGVRTPSDVSVSSLGAFSWDSRSAARSVVAGPRIYQVGAEVSARLIPCDPGRVSSVSSAESPLLSCGVPAADQPRRLKASPVVQARARDSGVPAGHLTPNTPRVVTMAELSPPVPNTVSPGVLSLDEEFARLRQDIAAERSERYALASMVESLLNGCYGQNLEQPGEDASALTSRPKRRCSSEVPGEEGGHHGGTFSAAEFSPEAPSAELGQSFQTILGEEWLSGAGSPEPRGYVSQGPAGSPGDAHLVEGDSRNVTLSLQGSAFLEAMPPGPPMPAFRDGRQAAQGAAGSMRPCVSRAGLDSSSAGIAAEDPLLVDTEATLAQLESELLRGSEGTSGAGTAAARAAALPAGCRTPPSARARAAQGSPGFCLESKTPLAASPVTPVSLHSATAREGAQARLAASPVSPVSLRSVSAQEAEPAAPRLSEPAGQDAVHEPSASGEDLGFYRQKCLELATQVHRRDAERVQLRRELNQARDAAGIR